MNNSKVAKEDRPIFRLLKIVKGSFQNQFNISKIFVAIIIMVVALLGPIIQLSVRDIQEIQVQRVSSLINKMPPEILKQIKAISNGGSTNSALVVNDDFVHATINFLKNFKGLSIALPKGFSPSALQASLEALTISKLSFNMLSQVFSTSILYSLAWGIFSIIKDKNSVDSNRVMYINYNKHTILFFKILSSSCMFMFVVIGADSIGILLVKVLGKGYIDAKIVEQLLTQLFGIFVFYFFIQIFLRFIISGINSKKLKGIVMATWLLSTAFLYIILSIVLGVRFDLSDVIKDNIYVFSFIPIINIVVLPLVLYGIVPLWTIIPISIQMIIAIGLIWKPTSSAVKNYLCS